MERSRMTTHDFVVAPNHPLEFRHLLSSSPALSILITAKMVAAFNKKEVLSWYVKLKENVESDLPKSQPAAISLLAAGDMAAPPYSGGGHEGEWVVSIREKLERAKQDESSSPWAKLSIYRIPKSLHRGDGDNKAYYPQIVSLGPYHRGRLPDMDCHKWRSLYQALHRAGHDVNCYLDAVRALEDRTRACYEGGVSYLSSNDFVEMMVLDGCFVLELFRGAAGEGFKELGYDRNDPVFAMRGTMHSVQRDMIMLENQIPLFVLDRLLGLQIGQPDQSGLVASLAIRFFDPLMPTDEPLRRAKLEPSTTATDFDSLAGVGLHCLDVFRYSLLHTTGLKPLPRLWIKRWSHNRRVADKRQQQLIHCVTELRESGIKFKQRNTDRFWDIKFRNGVLMIPRILIHDGTKSLFLNLIAFEQCHMDCSNVITSYVIFMNNLINSEEDVSYLHYCGIVEHWLGNDEEVADLFNRLCQEVVFDIKDSYLSSTSEQVNKYYDHKWNAWRASLRHKYFNNPWAIISFIAAVVLLSLTFTQTFYSVYGYYKPFIS